jgi:hypothetical protein
VGPRYSIPTCALNRRWSRCVTPPRGSWPGNQAVNGERSNLEDCNIAREGEAANDESCREIMNPMQPRAVISLAQPDVEANFMQPGEVNSTQPEVEANPMQPREVNQM